MKNSKKNDEVTVLQDSTSSNVDVKSNKESISNIIPKLELINHPQWVTWKKELVNDRNTKVPYQLNGYKASTTNPKTWTSYKQLGNKDKGFVFSSDDDYLFIDLDHVLINGYLVEWAREIVENINSYTEISTSGDGLHIYVKSSEKLDLANKTKFDDNTVLEIYYKNRYAVVTENVFEDMDTIIESKCDVLYSYANPSNSSTSIEIDMSRESMLSVEEIIKKLKASNSWEVDEFDMSDQSTADLQLANHIVYFCNGDYEVYKEVFNLHDFGQRDKWKSRKDYRERTYKKAMNNRDKFYSNKEASPFKKGATPLSLLKGFSMNKEAQKRYREMKFLFEGLIVQGYHHYMYGPAGAGKTTIAYFLMIEMAKKFSNKNFIFFYLDGALTMAAVMQNHIEDLGLKNVQLLTEGSSTDYNELMESFTKHQVSLHDYVFIYDTFKFLSADMNNKNANKKAMHLIKDLTRLGATFISLGHTNKDKKRESGTAEIEQDSDAMLRVDSQTDDKTITTSITRGGRCRFDVEECSFEYEAGDPTTVVSLSLFTPIEQDEETRKICKEVILLLKDGEKKQKYIEENIDLVGRNTLLKILRDYNKIGYWKISKGDKNSKIYSLNPYPEIEGF